MTKYFFKNKLIDFSRLIFRDHQLKKKIKLLLKAHLLFKISHFKDQILNDKPCFYKLNQYEKNTNNRLNYYLLIYFEFTMNQFAFLLRLHTNYHLIDLENFLLLTFFIKKVLKLYKFLIYNLFVFLQQITKKSQSLEIKYKSIIKSTNYQIQF